MVPTQSDLKMWYVLQKLRKLTRYFQIEFHYSCALLCDVKVASSNQTIYSKIYYARK